MSVEAGPKLLKPESVPDETALFSFEKKKEDSNPDAKRVVVTFDNPGAYNGLSPVVSQLLTDHRCSGITILVSGWAHSEFIKDERFRSFENVPPSVDSDNPARRTILADILEETNKYEPDVILCSISSKNGPESVGFFGGRENFGAKKIFFFADSWNATPFFNGKIDPNTSPESRIDGVFCCDEIAKKLAMRSLQGLPESAFIVSGSPVIDSLYVEHPEQFRADARKKLNIDSAAIAILFAGDVTGEYSPEDYGGIDADNINIRTFERTFEALHSAARSHPEKKFVLLIRPHPREGARDQLIQRALTLETAQNMEVRKAAYPEISIQEARYASDAIASMASTENFLMPRIGRRAFFLAFSEKGLGDPIIRKVYGDTEHDICEAEPLITFIREPLELAEHFSNIRMALTPAHDLNKTQKNSANRIIDEILRA